MVIGDITSETIERLQLKDKEFELFVRRLLLAERALRHSDAKVRGPVATYRSDDKRDLVFEVRTTPKIARSDFLAAMTWDEPGQTWYSCKGGRHWRQSFLKELGRKAAKDGQPPGTRVKLRPPEILLEHLCRGARFVFVIAEGTLGGGDFLDEVAETLSFWIDRGGHPQPPRLREQLELIDANDLADFIATQRPPNLGERIRRALGLDMPTGFMPWRQWTDTLGGRDIPEFEADPGRSAIMAAIADESNRAIRVFGPPGTGKTRVVHEGIRRLGDDARARVRYCDDLDAAHRLGSWLRDAGGVWLVLDELRTIDVEQLLPTFEANAARDARLFLVGTADEGTRTEPDRAFDLAPLEDRATERMIHQELGRSGSIARPQDVALVRRLSENYPWYAVLLARSIAMDPTSIARGEDEATRWNFGARRVLAGSPTKEYASDAVWTREAELRAKCLLVAMMTRDLELPWDEIWTTRGAEIARAIGEPQSGHEVQKRELACRTRQLLRQSGLRDQRRYVSPNNLARLILNHFFGGPDGPNLGPRLRRHAPEYRGPLLEIAKAVHANQAVIDDFVRGEWHELARRATEGGIEQVTEFLRDQEPSHKAAIEAPEAAALAIAETLACFDEHVLASAEIWGALRSVLARVIHRAISTKAFLAAESALLRLALVDDDPWDNNSTGLWKSIFLPGLHQTHQPWPVRLGRLRERLSDDDSRVRQLALHATSGAIRPHETGIGHTQTDELDGDWPVPATLADYWQMKNSLWAHLLEACQWPEEELADQARRIVATRLHAAIGRGVGAGELTRLVDQIPTWNLQQKRVLADSIARRRHHEGIQSSHELLDTVARLEEVLTPRDLRERIVARFRTWLDDEENPKHEQEHDRRLAGEFLDRPDDQAWALSWLLKPEVYRRDRFFHALGFVDEGLTIQPRLVELVRARNAPRVLALYWHGRTDNRGPEEIEAWIGQHIDDPELAPAFIAFTVVQPPSIERLERLRRLIARGASSDALGSMIHRGWAEDLPPDEVLAFIREATNREELANLALALVSKLLDRNHPEVLNQDLLDLLQHLLGILVGQRVVIGNQRWFESGMLELAEAGRYEAAADLAVKALEISNENPDTSLGHEVVRELLSRGFGDQLWPYLARAMLEHPLLLLPWQLARESILEHVSSDQVLAWVGHEPQRARLVAQMTNPHDDTLGEVVRELLIRFGPDGGVADDLEARARSTPGLVTGSTSFEQQQRINAAGWARDPHPSVRAWARQLEDSLRRSIEEDESRRRFRRKHG